MSDILTSHHHVKNMILSPKGQAHVKTLLLLAKSEGDVMINKNKNIQYQCFPVKSYFFTTIVLWRFDINIIFIHLYTLLIIV